MTPDSRCTCRRNLTLLRPVFAAERVETWQNDVHAGVIWSCSRLLPSRTCVCHIVSGNMTNDVHGGEIWSCLRLRPLRTCFSCRVSGNLTNDVHAGDIWSCLRLRPSRTYFCHIVSGNMTKWCTWRGNLIMFKIAAEKDLCLLHGEWEHDKWCTCSTARQIRFKQKVLSNAQDYPNPPSWCLGAPNNHNRKSCYIKFFFTTLWGVLDGGLNQGYLGPLDINLEGLDSFVLWKGLFV